jgi:hypothetical protein
VIGALCLSSWAAAARAQEPAPATTAADPTDAPSTPSGADAEYGPPLITADERKAWEGKHGGKYRSALTAENPDAAAKDELILGARTALYSLTLYEQEGETEKFKEVVRQLSEELRRSITKKAPRDVMNAEIVRIAPDLLDKGPKSRLNAVILVAGLSIDAHSPQGPPPKPYVPGHKVLLNVLNEPSQLVVCKIWAANGLARICRDGDPGVNDRNAIAADLVTALDSPQAKLPANWWYRMRLLDALGDSGLVYNLVQKPIVIDALMKVLADPQEDWIIRSTAARAVTQLPWTATTNVQLVTYEIASLTREMAQARNQQIEAAQARNQPPAGARWLPGYFNVYMSFMPDTSEKMQKRWGLRQQVERPGLGASRPVVEAAYQVVLPVINSVTGNANPVPTPAALLQNLDNWIRNNTPQNLKVTPESDELSLTQPPPQPMAGGGHSTSWSADGRQRGDRRERRESMIATRASA